MNMENLFEKAKEVKLSPEEMGKLDNKVRAHVNANPIPVHSPIVLPTIIVALAVVGAFYLFTKPITAPQSNNLPPAQTSPKPNQNTDPLNDPGKTTATSSPIKKVDVKIENNPDIVPENTPPSPPGTSSPGTP